VWDKNVGDRPVTGTGLGDLSTCRYQKAAPALLSSRAGLPDLVPRAEITESARQAQKSDDDQLNLPRSGHAEMPAGGQRDYVV
jgi:hypothetical protein